MFFALLMLLFASAAHAFDVLKTDDLLPRIEETSTRAGGPIVVAAAGASTEAALRRLLRAHPEAPCSLERVPLMGEPQQDMSRLLERSRVACGMRVSPGGAEGEWLVSFHGTCAELRATEASVWLGPEGEEGPLPTGEGLSVAAPQPALAVPASPGSTLDPTRLLLLERSLPDPTTALLSSAIVGFGSGHFYARDTKGGILYAGLQAGGLAVWGLSRFAGAQSFTAEGLRTSQVLGTLGLTLSLGARMVDAGTAPAAAHTTARRQIERQIP